MNQTENLRLPQWEAEDRIMRTDFNNAMASIDTALAEKADADTVATLQSAVNAMPRIATGSYSGDSTYPREISLGFTPKAVLLMRKDGLTWNSASVYGGLFATGLSLNMKAEICENGFRLLREKTNQTGDTYHYLAIG